MTDSSSSPSAYPFVTVFSNPDCQPCKLTKKWLTQRDIPFAEESLSDNDEAVALANLYGVKSAPMVIIGPEHPTTSESSAESSIVISGFRPDALERTLTPATTEARDALAREAA